MEMKIKEKMELSFGDLIKAAYQVWGSGRAEKMLRLAISTRLVIFREQPHFFDFFREGNVPIV